MRLPEYRQFYEKPSLSNNRNVLNSALENHYNFLFMQNSGKSDGFTSKHQLDWKKELIFKKSLKYICVLHQHFLCLPEAQNMGT